jgi:hypothetical protein
MAKNPKTRIDEYPGIRVPEPELEPKQQTPAQGRTEDKPKRFHTTVYLDKEFYGKVKIALIQEGKDRDFNRLVNDLLKDWLEMYGE